MAEASLRSDEGIALVLAVLAHGGLVAALALHPAKPAAPHAQRMQVTLADDVGLTATSPDPQAKAAPDLAPTLGEVQATAPVPEPVAKTAPQFAARVPPPPPRPVAVGRVEPSPLPKPQPRPLPVPTHTPKPAPSTKPVKPSPKQSAADPIGAAIAAQKPAKPVTKPVAKTFSDPIGQAISSRDAAPAHKSHQPEGGSRLGADFLKGAGATTAGKAPNAGAANAGPAVRAALAGAISRALKPHWRVPQGVDTDQLVTILSFDLSRDGTLAGPVQVISQDGVTDANRRQAELHKENAIRAVKLAQPFQLPPEYYDAWKHLTNVRFDRNLSQ